MAKKISATKDSLIKVGASHTNFLLTPAASRTHYGEHRLDRGGIPYAYPTKKAEGAWFIKSNWDGKILGLLEEGDDDWTFMKIKDHQQVPRWLSPSLRGIVGSTIYNLHSSIRSGPTAEAAIADGLGISPVRETVTRSPTQLQREIDDYLGRPK